MTRDEYNELEPLVRAAFAVAALVRIGRFEYGMKPRRLTDEELALEAALPAVPKIIDKGSERLQ